MTAVRTPTTTSSAPSTTSGERDRRIIALTAGALAIGLALVWYAILFVRFRDGALVDGQWIYGFGDAWGFDLEAYVHAAARLVSEGSLYDQALTQARFEPGAPDMFYYAPPLGVAMLPITDVAVADSSIAWYVLRIAALLAACLLMPVRPAVRVLSFVMISFTLWAMKDAVLGNVSILLVLPLVLAWRWMDRPLGSIALAAAISVRPGIAVFMLWQLLRRQWRALAWTIGAGLVLMLMTLPFVGIAGYVDYFTVAANLQVPLGPSENVDFGATVMTLGGSETAITLARVGSIVFAGGLMLLSLRRGREVSFMVTLCASLLVIPLLWPLYLITLIVPLAFLAQRLRPAVLLIPLLSWLPPFLSPFILLATIGLLFLVRGEAEATAESDSTLQPSAAAGHA